MGTAGMSLGKHDNSEWPPAGTVTLKGYFQWKTGVPDLEEGMGGTGTRTASNQIEVRMISHAAGLLESKGVMTIHKCP